jgi:hypothetical protein
VTIHLVGACPDCDKLISHQLIDLAGDGLGNAVIAAADQVKEWQDANLVVQSPKLAPLVVGHGADCPRFLRQSQVEG